MTYASSESVENTARLRSQDTANVLAGLYQKSNTSWESASPQALQHSTGHTELLKATRSRKSTNCGTTVAQAKLWHIFPKP